jgi:hypothetical protein
MFKMCEPDQTIPAGPSLLEWLREPKSSLLSKIVIQVPVQTVIYDSILECWNEIVQIRSTSIARGKAVL